MVRSTLLRGLQFEKVFESASWQAHLGVDVILDHEYLRETKSVRSDFRCTIRLVESASEELFAFQKIADLFRLFVSGDFFSTLETWVFVWNR